jgi:V8-like Glu-specific endopeptidase
MLKITSVVIAGLLLGCQPTAGNDVQSLVNKNDAVFAEDFLGFYRSILPFDDRGTKVYENMRDHLNAVGYVHVRHKIGKSYYEKSTATGFLISDRYLLTNHHVLAQINEIECFKAKDIFEKRRLCSGDEVFDEENKVIRKLRYNGNIAFQRDLCLPKEGHPIDINFGKYKVNSKPGLSTHTLANCAKVLVSNQEYDFAIIELTEPVPQTEQFKYIPFTLDTRDPEKVLAESPGVSVFVAGHPNDDNNGDPKKVAITDHFDGAPNFVQNNIAEFEKTGCKLFSWQKFPDNEEGKKFADIAAKKEQLALRKRYPHTMLHNCDTVNGSSGSPVMWRTTKLFDGADDLKVTGLHWNGWTSSKGNYYMPGGKVHDDSEAVEGGHDIFADMPYRPSNSMIKISEIAKYMHATMPTSVDRDGFVKKFGDAFSQPDNNAAFDGFYRHLKKTCESGEYVDGAQITQPIFYVDNLAKAMAFYINKNADALKNNFVCDQGNNLESCGWEHIQARGSNKFLWTKAYELIDSFHVCYTGKAALEEMLRLFPLPT